MKAVAVLFAAALAVSACTGIHGHSQSRTPSIPTTPPPASTKPASAPPLTLRLDLDTTTARAGTEIHGILWFTNTTSHVIVTDCQIWVGLTNARVPFQPASTLKACRRSILPGISRIPITVLTTYTACTDDRVPEALRCGPHDEIPALPAGRYHVVVLVPPLEKPLPQPSNVTVVVT